MKRVITTTLIIVFFISMKGYTQHKPFLFGFKIAPNIGWMKPDHKDYINEGSEVNFSWGFVTEFFLMENYAIATGFNVVYITGKLGYPDSLDNHQGTMIRKYRTQYIEIPLLLKMKTRDFKGFKFYGQIGLGTGFLIGAKADDIFKADGINPVKDDGNNIKDEMKSNRLSLILGAGFEYGLGGSTALTFGINFNNGFTDILKDYNKVYPEIGHAARINFVELSFGIIF